MQLRYTKGGAQVLEGRFRVTPQRLRAMVGSEPVAYRVEDIHTYEWREATGPPSRQQVQRGRCATESPSSCRRFMRRGGSP